MAEMEWHGVEDDPRANWLLRIGLAAAVVLILAAGIYFWAQIRREDRIDHFRQAVLAGDIEKVQQSLAPSLAQRVDRPVLRAWLDWIGEHRDQFTSGRWGLQADSGPEGIRSFDVTGPEEDWLARPSDFHIYRDHARRLISEIRQGMGDEVWREFDHDLQDRQRRHRLQDLARRLGASTLLHPERPMPHKTFTREGRFVLQFRRALTNSAGEEKNLVAEFVFEPWRGRLNDILLEDRGRD
jgi:hypothetical protein